MSKITLPEAVQFLIDANIEGVHTSIPGIVTSYDGHKTRRATVQPSVRLPSSNGVLMDIPPIGGVPVVFPSSALGTLFFPINPGDGVTLVFSEVGIGRYLQSDGSDLADPGSLDRHALTDAIAIPGLWTWSSAPEFPASATMDAVVLVSGNGSIVELGATVGIRNAQTDLRAELETIYAELDQLRQDLTLNFTNVGAGISAGASFLTAAVAAATAAATLHTVARAQVALDKASLQELLK
jgi:hypothetical protein